jgi:hypothetical protein
MKDYVNLVPTNLVKKVEKRDRATVVVGTIGSILMMGCWVYFLLALVA